MNERAERARRVTCLYLPVTCFIGLTVVCTWYILKYVICDAGIFFGVRLMWPMLMIAINRFPTDGSNGRMDPTDGSIRISHERE